MEPTSVGGEETAPPERIFTDYVQSLSAEPADDAASFAKLSQALRSLLIRELKRRRLWSTPPRYLGVYGAGETWTTEALNELFAECYVYVFVDRLRGLRRRAEVERDVGGLVVRSVRNFLHDTQKRHDPLGYRIYELLHQAVGRLVAAGCFEIVRGDPRLRNDTILVSPRSGEFSLELSAELRPLVVDVVEHLLSDLAASWGRSELVDELTERLSLLPGSGVLAFRFGDLVSLMKEEVRSRWYARQRDPGEEVLADGDDVDVATLAGFDEEVLGRHSFQRLLDCVANGIEELSRSQKTRDYLRRLWLFLRGWAAEPVEGAPPAEDDEAPHVELTTADRVPSDNRMSKVLGIPRNRIPRLRATLGKQVSRCRTTLGRSEGVAVRTLGAPGSAAQNAGLQALARKAAAEDAGVERREGPPRPGDVFLFPGGPGDGPEWAVVKVDEEDARRHLAVPLDDFPGAGSRDVTLPEEGENGVTRLRCAHAVWLDVSAFAAGRRSGRISEEAVERSRRQAMTSRFGDEQFSETRRPTAVERETDRDPEYRIRMAEVDAARTELAERHGAVSARILDAAGRFRRKSRIRGLLAVAATVLLAVALLFAVRQNEKLTELERERDALAAPELNLPVVFLSREGPQRGVDDPIRVAPSARRVVLVLEVVSPEEHPAYRVRMTAGSRALLTSDELERTESGTVSLEVPRGLLVEGEVRIRIYGLGRGAEDLLEDYRVTVELTAP